MEYLKNHQEITNRELKKLTAFSINSLKSDSENGISATKAIDNIRRKIWDDFIETSFIYHYKDHFEEVYRIYRLSFDNYDNNKIDVVKAVLKNEAYDEFLKRLKIKKVSNYTYGEDFDNITYEDFVTHLLKYHVYQKCYNRFGENGELYKLLFEANAYKYFTFNKFDGHVVNSTLYKNIFSEYYPNKQIPIATYKENEYGGGYYEISSSVDRTNISTSERLINNFNSSIQQEGFTTAEESVIKTSIDKLSNVEKSFLFHIMCKALGDNIANNTTQKKNNEKPFNLPATELCRLMSIIEIKDLNSFDKMKYRDTVHYKVLTKGIEYIEKDERIMFIENLVKKIKDLNLSDTTKYIKSILYKEHTKLTNLKKLAKNE